MLCPGCFQEKGEAAPVCPHCEFDESERRSPLVLPYRTILNKQYIVGRVLGKPGGFGITYLGWDAQLETPVAIKEYLPRDLAGRHYDHLSVEPHTHDDEGLFKYGLEQFIQEARTIAKINHPNVVRVRNFFTENGTAYLVMDYYEGVTLSEYMVSLGGKIGEQPAIGIMLRVLDGLKEIHGKGFLHRDIKPHNIYLTTEGRPILLDLGAARTAVGDKSRSLSVLYTSGFTPFEQYYRRGDHGAWTDVYACGATLYYVLTGVVPPDAPGRLGEDELAHPCQLEPALSATVGDVVMQALAMDPSKRPQTAQHFQMLLAAAIGENVDDGQEVKDTSGGQPQYVTAPVEQDSAGQTSGKTSGLAVLAGAAAHGEQPNGAVVNEQPQAVDAGEQMPHSVNAFQPTVHAQPQITPVQQSVRQSRPQSSGDEQMAVQDENKSPSGQEASSGAKRLWIPAAMIVLGICMLLAIFLSPAGIFPWGMKKNETGPQAGPVQENIPPQGQAGTQPQQNTGAPANGSVPNGASAGAGNNAPPVQATADTGQDDSEEAPAATTRSRSKTGGGIVFVEGTAPGQNTSGGTKGSTRPK